MKRRMKMTLEDALDIVMTEVELLHEGRKPDGGYVTAMCMVEDAVLRYMKIEKGFDKLQDIIKKKERYRRVVLSEPECIYSGVSKCSEHELNGKASIVVEDDNVRSES